MATKDELKAVRVIRFAAFGGTSTVAELSFLSDRQALLLTAYK